MKIHLCLFSYGGADAGTLDALMAELRLAEQKKVKTDYHRIHDDALISRSRSKAMSDFLRGDAEVFFMLDHDIQWEPGMVVSTCDRAKEKKAIVGGMYAMRGKHAGCAGRLKGERVRIVPGKDEFHEAEYVPGGFTAIPRAVVEETLRACHAAGEMGHLDDSSESHAMRVRECLYNDGSPFYDFFRPITVPSSFASGKHEYLSEDWSFVWRARRASPERRMWLWSQPILAHWGRHPFLMTEAGQGFAPASLVR